MPDHAGEPLVPDFDQPIALPDPFADHPGALAASTPAAADALALLDAAGEVRPLEELEAELIRYAVTHYRGQMSEVARRLQIGRSTLYRKLEALGLNTERDEADSDAVAAERQPLKIA
jgi:DNA-binding NtrC family response regulator